MISCQKPISLGHLVFIAYEGCKSLCPNILCKELLLGGPHIKLVLLLQHDGFKSGFTLMAHNIWFTWFAENTKSTGWENWTTERCHRWCFCSATVRGCSKWSSCELWWNWSCYMRPLLWCHRTVAISLFTKNPFGTKCIWIYCNIFPFLPWNKQSGFLFYGSLYCG